VGAERLDSNKEVLSLLL